MSELKNRADLKSNLPSVEDIMQIPGLDRDSAGMVHAVLERHHTDPDFTHEDALQECDQILDTCGVVSLDIEAADSYNDEGIRLCPPFTYCNAGDSYATTLARDHENGTWVIASWADLAEAYEKEHKLGDFEEFDECPDSCVDCGHSKLNLESYKAGHWEGSIFVGEGTRYTFVCGSCNRHHTAAEGFEPSNDFDPMDEV